MWRLGSIYSPNDIYITRAMLIYEQFLRGKYKYKYGYKFQYKYKYGYKYKYKYKYKCNLL